MKSLPKTYAFDDQLLHTSVDPVTPSEYKQRYCPSATGTVIPIIIDNGGYALRAGYATDSEPRVVYRSLVGRPRTKRLGDYCLVGSEMDAQDIVRLRARSPFDGNIVCHFDLMEYVLDKTFMLLGLEGSDRVNHPIIISEPLCNPNICRERMTDLLFTCYGVPSVCYTVDSLASYFYYNQQQQHENERGEKKKEKESGEVRNIHLTTNHTTMPDGLVISSSYSSTHIIPFLNNQARVDRALRIDVGSMHAHNLLFTSWALRCPLLRNSLTLLRCQVRAEMCGDVW